MSILLSLAYLFFVGSVFGWVLELLYRNWKHRGRKWINPGFCTGPYLPIYGFGLCALYLLASLEQYRFFGHPITNKLVLFLTMMVCMAAIEYAAGIFCLKCLKVRLWDYSGEWGNVQGIICPRFCAAWAVLGAVYYFLIHPHILKGLNWLSRNLAFSFFIGMFFGVLLLDVAHSGNLVVRLRKFAEENRVILRYEGIKDHIRNAQRDASERYHFFRPFQSVHPLQTHLKEMLDTLERQRSR